MNSNNVKKYVMKFCNKLENKLWELKIKILVIKTV